MRNPIFSFIVVFVILTFSSCKKSESPVTEGEQPDSTTTPTTGDFGYMIVYTNNYVYTDPKAGVIALDDIDISIGNSSKGKISTIANSKIYYGTKNTVSIKLPVGNFAVKGTTTSGVSRTANIKIVKNDTVRVKLDYSYNDPNSNSYYIEYYADGKLKKYNAASTLAKWNFYFFNVQSFNPVGTCVNNIGHFNGPGVNYSVGASPVNLKFSRSSMKLKPGLGAYTFSSGSLIPAFEEGSVSCSYPDSYAKLNVTEVKIIEDMGLEKRGYYTGTFDAIVYSAPVIGSTPVKHIITKGKFFAYMGDINFSN